MQSAFKMLNIASYLEQIKKSILVVAILSLSACSSPALNSIMLGSPSGIIGSGVRDKLVEPGVWQVDARSADGFQSVTRAQGLALGRATDLVESAGEQYVQVLDFRGTENSIRGRGTIGADVTLLIKGVSDIDAPIACRAVSEDRCSVLSIADARTKVTSLMDRYRR